MEEEGGRRVAGREADRGRKWGEGKSSEWETEGGGEGERTHTTEAEGAGSGGGADSTVPPEAFSLLKLNSFRRANDQRKIDGKIAYKLDIRNLAVSCCWCRWLWRRRPSCWMIREDESSQRGAKFDIGGEGGNERVGANNLGLYSVNK